MRSFIFSFDAAQYYGLELHAGDLGFDVYRGYLINLLRSQAQISSVMLSPCFTPELRGFCPQPSLTKDTLQIELMLEEDEYAYAQAVGKRLLKARGCIDWQSMVISWLIAREGIELWDVLPSANIEEKGVLYALNPELACFHALSIKIGVEGERLALPATPYRFS